MKESWWLYILCFMVTSIVPLYCLTELLVFTVALSSRFFCWQFPSWEHVSFSLQLHCFLGCIMLPMVSIFFVLIFYDLRCVTCTTVADMNIISVENYSKGVYDWDCVCSLDLGNPNRCLMLRIYNKVGWTKLYFYFSVLVCIWRVYPSVCL